MRHYVKYGVITGYILTLLILLGGFYYAHQERMKLVRMTEDVMLLHKEAVDHWESLAMLYESLSKGQDRMILTQEDLAKLFDKMIALQANFSASYSTLETEQLWLLSLRQDKRPEFPMPESVRKRLAVP